MKWFLGVKSPNHDCQLSQSDREHSQPSYYAWQQPLRQQREGFEEHDMDLGPTSTMVLDHRGGPSETYS